MIGTPPSFAGTPESARGDYDVLAEMLRAVRLTGSVFLDACFSAPFGVVNPKQYDERTPLAHLRHVSVFHLIASGSCTVEIATGERRTATAGDILLIRLPTRISSGTATLPTWRSDQICFAKVPSTGCGTSNMAAAGSKPAWCADFSSPRNSCLLRSFAPCRRCGSTTRVTTRSAPS
jgi:hypothetical protein